MIRVLHVLETIGSGGVERRRLSIAKLLDKSKFELKIVCTNAYGEFPEEFKRQGVEVIPIGSLKSMFDFNQHKKVMKIIDDYKPHIIHGAVFEGVTMAAINGFLKRVPIVIIEETSDPQYRTWKGNLLMKLFSVLSTKVIGVSPAAIHYLKNKIHLSPTKVELINNGIAQPREISVVESDELKNALNIQTDDVVIGTVGRMHDDTNKRFSDLISAFHLLSKQYQNVKLLMVGDGREREKYERQVKELNIEDKVIFVGYQNDVALYYSIFSIFTLVSSHESFGLVLAEAMLHKLPIVATRVGGMQYIVDDNETGFLVEKYDIHQIKEKLELLCVNKSLRTDFGMKGFKKANLHYTEDRYVKHIQDLYVELVEERDI
jgi:L-malate glycosyltransferase